MSPILYQLGDANTGLQGFIDGLTSSSTGVTGAGLWDQITPAIPFIVTMFLFAFGYGVVRKVLRRGSKGKSI